VAWSLFLIGDAGAPREGDPVLQALAQAAGRASDRATIVFLGDNIYPAGLPDVGMPDRARAESLLIRQIEVFRWSGARGYFVPGNHDWARHRPDGLVAIRRQGDFIRANAGALAELVPAEGCPGPEVRDVGPVFRLVLLDTQWWLHEHEKPVHPTSSCPADRPEEFVAGLKTAVRAEGRQVVVLAHHPLASGGEHGGRFSLEHHLFPLREARSWLWVPLPIIGSLYPLLRSSGVSPQDIPDRRNRVMREAIESALAETRPLAYVSGHEHNLQVLQGGAARWLLVSGTGYYGHTTHAVWLAATRYAAALSGFMRIDALRSGQIRLGVVAIGDDGQAREVFSMWLE
jgi:hypothetical protein